MSLVDRTVSPAGDRRERAVPCIWCDADTWNLDAICDGCGGEDRPARVWPSAKQHFAAKRADTDHAEVDDADLAHETDGPPNEDRGVVAVKLVGLDLSLTCTGAAQVAGDEISTTTFQDGHKGPQRLARLRDGILAYCAGATLVAVEGYSMGTARQASHAHGLGELGGVVRVALFEAGIAYVDVPPACVKKLATGKGNANKNEVFSAAIRRLGYGGTSTDEADARWLLEAAMQGLFHPARTELPLLHLDGLTKVEWPGQAAA